MKRNNSITYKGFYGSINFDQEEKIFFGQIEFIKDLVNYEARDAENLVNSFQEAVDDYLDTCKALSKEPNKTFKGSFNVRISTDLHKKASYIASEKSISLNDFVKKAITYAISHKNDMDDNWVIN